MSQKPDLSDRRRSYTDTLDEMLPKSRRTSTEFLPPKVGYPQVENEKRVRREIANCNERRRMQSINAGFENLRVLLPPVQEGEKLSKATILQLTAKFINSLLMRVTALEHEVAVYRQSAGVTAPSVLADITDEVTLGCGRKRRSEDDVKALGSGSKIEKRSVESESSFLDLDDGNASGRSSECYDNNFGCSPSSGTQRVSTVASVSPSESTSSTAARLEHLVMAIEQIEGGAPGSAGKAEALIDSYAYESHRSSMFYKFPSAVSTHLRPYPYNLSGSDAQVLKSNINPFTEEFILNSPPSELTADMVSTDVCGEKDPLSVPIDDYSSVAKLLNRPIPHKYLHRPQVVVNNSH